MKTTMTAVLAFSMFVFGAFAKNAPKQETSTTKSTVKKSGKGHKKSTTSTTSSVAKPAVTVAKSAK